MSFIDLFPTAILAKTLNNITPLEIKDYKNFIKNDSLVDNKISGKYTENQSLLNNPLFSKLSTQILDFSKEYLTELNHEVKGLQIINSWGTFYSEGEGSNVHSHKNSYISGIFYLTEGTPLEFHHPNRDKWSFYSLNSNNPPNARNINVLKLDIFSNLLILFPSWLNHSVSPSVSKERMSIAFNIIPKGEFGPDTGKLYL